MYCYTIGVLKEEGWTIKPVEKEELVTVSYGIGNRVSGTILYKMYDVTPTTKLEIERLLGIGK